MNTKFKIYEDDMFFLNNETGYWNNLNKTYKKQSNVDDYIKGLIEYNLSGGGENVYLEQSVINKEFNKIKRQTAFHNTVKPVNINREKIVFLNGYYDVNGFHQMEETEIPFSPFQVNRRYQTYEKSQMTKMENFINKISCGDEEIKQLLIEVTGAALLPKGLSIMIILHSQHSTSGKGTYVDVLNRVLGKELVGQVDQSKFIGGNKTNFPLATIKGKNLVTMDELPVQLNNTATETIKEYIDSKQFITIERKGVDTEEILNTPIWVATTNKNVNIHNVDDAIKKRIIHIPFNMNANGNTTFTTTEIEEILNDKEGLDWLTEQGCKNIFKVLQRPGVRAEKFTVPQASEKFWKIIDNNNIVGDVIRSSEVVSGLIQAKAEFIAHDDLREAFNTWKQKNIEERVTYKGFTHEFYNYFSSRKLGKTEEDEDENEVKGISIVWFKKDEPEVEEPVKETEEPQFEGIVF